LPIVRICDRISGESIPNKTAPTAFYFRDDPKGATEHAWSIRRGEQAAPLLGFSKQDVFYYEARAIGSAGEIDWEQTAPIKEAAK
jgi:hypothetical protein